MLSQPDNETGILGIRVQIREITFPIALTPASATAVAAPVVFYKKTTGQALLHNRMVDNKAGQAGKHLGEALDAKALLRDKHQVVKDGRCRRGEGARYAHRKRQTALAAVRLRLAHHKGADRAVGEYFDGEVAGEAGLVPARLLHGGVDKRQVCPAAEFSPVLLAVLGVLAVGHSAAGGAVGPTQGLTSRRRAVVE